MKTLSSVWVKGIAVMMRAGGGRVRAVDNNVLQITLCTLAVFILMLLMLIVMAVALTWHDHSLALSVLNAECHP